MVELKSSGEIEALQHAGQVVARVLSHVGEHATAGAALAELDELARSLLAEAGAQPVLEGHRHGRCAAAFPGVIRTSVNDEICHGTPGPRTLADGDLLSLDVAAAVEGWIGHAAITRPVGACSPEDVLLVRTCEQALADGIAAARPGGRLGDISRAIGVVARSAGYGIPPLGGHGLGHRLREEPRVANDGRAGRGMPLRPGLVLSVEPIFTAGGHDHLESRGHALITGDGRPAAHTGHTIAITETGPLVLTARPQS